MKLVDENTVCDDLGISKLTLYKWCGIHDDSIQPNLSKILPDRKSGLHNLKQMWSLIFLNRIKSVACLSGN